MCMPAAAAGLLTLYSEEVDVVEAIADFLPSGYSAPASDGGDVDSPLWREWHAAHLLGVATLAKLLQLQRDAVEPACDVAVARQHEYVAACFEVAQACRRCYLLQQQAWSA